MHRFISVISVTSCLFKLKMFPRGQRNLQLSQKLYVCTAFHDIYTNEKEIESLWGNNRKY